MGSILLRPNSIVVASTSSKNREFGDVLENKRS